MIDADDLRARVERLESSVSWLATTDPARRIAAIAAAIQVLAEPEREIGRELRHALERTSGLSSQGVAWALDTTLSAMDEGTLTAAFEACSRAAGPGARAIPRGLVAVVLSANVTTAPLFALVMPLLLGNVVLAKASARDDATAWALRTALKNVDEELAACLDVVVFDGGDVALEDVVLTRADSVVVYGSDSTVAELRRRTPVSCAFVPHGHGLGLGFLSREVVSDSHARARALRRFAMDVAAYDQRGCLSPHALVVEASAASARAVALELAEVALAEVAILCPRGPLPSTMVSPQLAWRSVAIARGELFEGDSFATSFEAEGPLRPSPGYRNVQVVPCADASALVAQATHFSGHLKVVGVGGDDAPTAELLAALRSPLAPRLVPMGQMQTPAFGTTWDGELPQAGLVRYAGAP